MVSKISYTFIREEEALDELYSAGRTPLMQSFKEWEKRETLEEKIDKVRQLAVKLKALDLVEANKMWGYFNICYKSGENVFLRGYYKHFLFIRKNYVVKITSFHYVGKKRKFNSVTFRF